MKKRPSPRSIRIPERWESEVVRRWKRSGLSFSEFVLEKILGDEYTSNTRGVGEGKETLAEGVTALINISTAVNRIDDKDEEVARELRTTNQLLTEIRNLLMSKAGYKR